MNDQHARRLLINSSLAISALAFVFFILAPPLGFPLTYEQAVRILEIILPVFLGYIGSATSFLLSPSRSAPAVYDDERRQFMSTLLLGPVVVFLFVLVAILASFGISNGSHGRPGEGMSIDTLAGAISAALGFVAVATNLIAGKLFAT